MSASPTRLDAQVREYPAPVRRAAPSVRGGLLHASEYVLLSYFCYTALLASVWNLPISHRTLALVVPCALAALACWEGTRGTKATGVFREWISPAVVLFAYQEVNWFAQAHSGYARENRWIGWDRLLLDNWHLRAGIESLGWVIPFLLELSYLLVYAIPPLALGILYWSGRRKGVDVFLFTFLLGTLLAYALLPYFPSDPPRFVFPGQDLPSINTAPRWLNLWLLDRYDIRTSVFPSGHVTAAFSAAFGMLLAFPERKRVGAMLFVLATAIAVTTVYGRYHFAVDGLAGLLVSAIAATISAAFFGVRSRASAKAPGGSTHRSGDYFGSESRL